VGILDVEKIVFLEVVEELDQFKRFLEIHFFIVENLLDLFIFTTFLQFFKMPLEIFTGR
jgi:hypothetical protein